MRDPTAPSTVATRLIWVGDDRAGRFYSANMRYFMHISNGLGVVEDEEGCELPDEAAARQAAIAAARDVMASDVREGQLDLTSFIEVEDEARTRLFRVTFAEAVTVTKAGTV